MWVSKYLLRHCIGNSVSMKAVTTVWGKGRFVILSYLGTLHIDVRDVKYVRVARTKRPRQVGHCLLRPSMAGLFAARWATLGGYGPFQMSSFKW
ncbi:hypothetical protein F5Y13DRAFT_164189 [Hypoxylon sp. FL1857]|nr:hypothetical protein F5Y13DRAFT_164189 [Hypoxylon sp. FL1857]